MTFLLIVEINDEVKKLIFETYEELMAQLAQPPFCTGLLRSWIVVPSNSDDSFPPHRVQKIVEALF